MKRNARAPLGAILAVLVTSCGTGQPPSPAGPSPAGPVQGAGDEELRAAVARQERLLQVLADRLDGLADRLARVEARRGGTGAPLDDAEAVEARRGGTGAPLDDAEARVERLTERIEELTRAVERVHSAGAQAGAARAQPPANPDPAAVYAVPVAGAPFRGSVDAPVTIVRGFEFACPYSHKSSATMDQLLAEYGKDLRIVYRDFIVHPALATIPAQAACAAHRQGRYFEMHDLIWTRGFEAGRDLGMENMERLASSLGLDMDQWRREMNGRCGDEMRRGQEELTKLGQRGTPTFWINGRYLSGAQPVEQFRALVDEELALAKKRIGKRGTTRANYYRKWVLGEGRKKLD